MAKGINIEFVADVRRFLGGTKDIEGALDDVADSLDDLGKDAEKTGDKIGESLESAGDEAKDAGKKIGKEIGDGAEDAEDAAKKMERKFRDAFDDVGDRSRKTGDDLGDNVRRGTEKAGEGFDDLKDEAGQSAREAAASFDGSMDSIVDMVQETAAGAFGGFGPAGAAAGLAAAAGAGVFYTMWQEKAEQTEKRIASMYEDMLESGNRFLSASYVNEGISKILNDDEEAIITYAQAQEIATRTGVDLTTVVRAYAGEAGAAATVSDALTRAQGDLEGQNSSTNAVLNGAADALATVAEGTVTAAEKAEIYTGAQVGSEEAARDFAVALAGQGQALADTRAQIEQNNNTLGAAEEKSRANEAALADLASGMLDVRSAGREAGASTEQLTKLQSDQERQFYEAATAAGIGADEARELARRYGLVPRNVSTTVTTPGAEEAIERARRLAEMVNGIPSRKTITFEGRNLGTANLVGYNPGTGAPIYGAARASGGVVEGPGGPLDDTILTRLSRGEYVLDAATVQRVGPGRLDQLNNGQLPPLPSPPKRTPVKLDRDDIRQLANAIGSVVLEGAASVTAKAIADKDRASHIAAHMGSKVF